MNEPVVAERIAVAHGHAGAADAALRIARGTGWAETLSTLALRLKIEVEGPTDRRQSGGE
jgi:hypothetical protein